MNIELSNTSTPRLYFFERAFLKYRSITIARSHPFFARRLILRGFRKLSAEQHPVLNPLALDSYQRRKGTITCSSSPKHRHLQRPLPKIVSGSKISRSSIFLTLTEFGYPEIGPQHRLYSFQATTRHLSV